MLLNLGCGSTFHPEWVNLDLYPVDPRVKEADLSKGIPLEDNSCAAVYHSHVLEHMTRERGLFFLRECYRVLKPEGLLRVVVPDLERIVQVYLTSLQSALEGGDPDPYDWIILELYDQVSRSSFGGEMAKHIAKATGQQRDFIRRRVGMEADVIWRALDEPQSRGLWQRVRKSSVRKVWFKLRAETAAAVVALLGGARFRNAFREGLFRQAGEIHRSMYDRYSLSRLMRAAGFADPRVCRGNESSIPDFPRYALDILGERTRKPDSLFMEATKPQQSSL